MSIYLPYAPVLYDEQVHRQTLPKINHKKSQLPTFPFSGIIAHDMEIIDAVLPALPYVQIALAILLTASILLQQRGSSLGGAFGGDNFSSAFHKRRGAELFLFKFSIGIAVLFVIATFLNILA